MIYIRDDGLVLLSRSYYINRPGADRIAEFARLGDGDIILGKIDPAGYKDLIDAAEMIRYVRQELGVPEAGGSD